MYKINLSDKGIRRSDNSKGVFVFLLSLFLVMAMLSSNRQHASVELVQAIEPVCFDYDVDTVLGAVSEPVEAVEEVAIDISDYQGTGFLTYGFEPEPEPEIVAEPVWEFLQSYQGARIDREYYELLATHCDAETLKKVVAISIAESGAGKHLPNRQSNFWGWFLGGDRNYDPSREVMAEQICNGISNYYPNIHLGVGVERYTGNDRAESWRGNFNWAFQSIK